MASKPNRLFVSAVEHVGDGAESGLSNLRRGPRWPLRLALVGLVALLLLTAWLAELAPLPGLPLLAAAGILLLWFLVRFGD
ncbi:MAG TPA: hypothetical protein VHS99_22600 [Chloroflexota bacterium]|jgi:hypothetical protein|nr:hypothetical protein [Chloroflexota bacterium]